MQTIDLINADMRGGRVLRLHQFGLPAHLAGNVAQHSFNMLALLYRLEGFIEHVERGSVIRTILHHDLPEATIGDIPYPTKQAPSIRDELARQEDEVRQKYGWQELSLKDDSLDIIFCLDRLEFLLHLRWLINERNIKDPQLIAAEGVVILTLANKSERGRRYLKEVGIDLPGEFDKSSAEYLR